MLTCLQEPCHGHIITVPSCFIFCLNINRWVNISNFLCPSRCREFIWAGEGFRIRASRWVCFQARCSGRLMSYLQITPCSHAAPSAHIKLQRWFKETTAQLCLSHCFWCKMRAFPGGQAGWNFTYFGKPSISSFWADLGPVGEERAPLTRWVQ